MGIVFLNKNFFPLERNDLTFRTSVRRESNFSTYNSLSEELHIYIYIYIYIYAYIIELVSSSSSSSSPFVRFHDSSRRARSKAILFAAARTAQKRKKRKERQGGGGEARKKPVTGVVLVVFKRMEGKVNTCLAILWSGAELEKERKGKRYSSSTWYVCNTSSAINVSRIARKRPLFGRPPRWSSTIPQRRREAAQEERGTRADSRAEEKGRGEGEGRPDFRVSYPPLNCTPTRKTNSSTWNASQWIHETSRDPSLARISLLSLPPSRCFSTIPRGGTCVVTRIPRAWKLN